MSAKNKTDLKLDFQTGSEITQEKFEHLIDSSVNKIDDLSIDANGNVGIGTTSSDAKLEVNGNIKSTGTDFLLDNESRRDGNGGSTRRALVHLNDSLYINYDSDYTGGVNIQGNVGIGASSPSAQLSLGEWNSGNAGPEGGTQLLLSGRHNTGTNKSSSDVTSYKLKIEGYNNDGGTVYPIYVRDENKYEDFWLKNRPSVTGLPTAYFAGNIGIGTTNPQAPLSILGDGKENNPDDSMHITSDCILFGGTNSGKEVNSAQISAGKHRSNTLCIVGMSSGTSAADRKIEMWAEDGLAVNGKVGIGTTSPEAKLDVVGDIKCTNLTQSSDRNLKENIQPLHEGLQSLMRYKPISYAWKKDDIKKRNYGFLAQDMQALHADTSIISGSEENHGLSISYTQLIPVLTKSIQELSDKVDSLAKKVN